MTSARPRDSSDTNQVATPAVDGGSTPDLELPKVERISLEFVSCRFFDAKQVQRSAKALSFHQDSKASRSASSTNGSVPSDA